MHVKDLVFKSVDLTDPLLAKVVHSIPNLESITIQGGSDLTCAEFCATETFRNLHKFRFKNIPNLVQLESLEHMPNLVEAQFPRNFVKECKFPPSVKILSIYGGSIDIGKHEEAREGTRMHEEARGGTRRHRRARGGTPTVVSHPLEILADCRRLSEIVGDCRRLSEIVGDCRRWPEGGGSVAEDRGRRTDPPQRGFPERQAQKRSKN
jgi:hypothetical protein